MSRPRASIQQNTHDPAHELCSLRRMYLRTLATRLLCSAFLAVLVTSALSVLPSGYRITLIGQDPSRQGRYIALLYKDFGWPAEVLLYTRLVSVDHKNRYVPTDRELTWLPADPTILRSLRLPARFGVGWHMDVADIAKLYYVSLVLCAACLAFRPSYAYRKARSRIRQQLCSTCGYPKLGLPEPRCPECGSPHSTR